MNWVDCEHWTGGAPLLGFLKDRSNAAIIRWFLLLSAPYVFSLTVWWAISVIKSICHEDVVLWTRLWLRSTRCGRRMKGGWLHVPASSYQVPALTAWQRWDRGSRGILFCSASSSSLSLLPHKSAHHGVLKKIQTGHGRKTKSGIWILSDGWNDLVFLDLNSSLGSFLLQQLWNVKFLSQTHLVCSECCINSIAVCERVCVDWASVIPPLCILCCGPLPPPSNGQVSDRSVGGGCSVWEQLSTPF